MADTPEERLDQMAEAVVDSIAALRHGFTHLPIEIVFPLAEHGMTRDEFIALIERARGLIVDEPIPSNAMGHLDQAMLGILTAMDMVAIALSEGIGWREDAVYMICTTALMNIRIATMIIEGELQ